MSQHDDPDQHDRLTPTEEAELRAKHIGEIARRAKGFTDWLEANGYGKKVIEGLDTRRMMQALADHERDEHGVANPLPILEDCLADVKRRYDSGD